MTSALVCSVSCMYSATKLKEEIVPSHLPVPWKFAISQGKDGSTIYSRRANYWTQEHRWTTVTLKKSKRGHWEKLLAGQPLVPLTIYFHLLYHCSFKHYKQTTTLYELIAKHHESICALDYDRYCYKVFCESIATLQLQRPEVLNYSLEIAVSTSIWVRLTCWMYVFICRYVFPSNSLLRVIINSPKNANVLFV